MKYIPGADTPPRILIPGVSTSAKQNKFMQDNYKKYLDDYIGIWNTDYDPIERIKFSSASDHMFMNQAVIVENDTVTFSHVNGVKDDTNKQRADLDTRMAIGSVTKSYTGALVEKFIDLGYITSRTALATAYLNPTYSFPENNITIDQLLTHTSRLSDIPYDVNAVSPTEGPAKWGFNYFKMYSQTGQIAVSAANMRLDFVSWFKDLTFPGTTVLPGQVGTPVATTIAVGQFSYSNMGYIMLGLICEEAYKNATSTTKLLETLYKEYIFDVVKMDTASAGYTSGYIEQPFDARNLFQGLPTTRAVNEAQAYTSWDGGTTYGFLMYAATLTHPLGVFSAGAVKSSPLDVAKFLPAMSKGALMSAAATEEFFNGRVDSTVQMNNYGTVPNSDPNIGSTYGSGIIKFQLNATVGGVAAQPTGRTLYTHSGLRDGFVVHTLYDRVLDISVVITVNVDWAFLTTSTFTRNIYKRYVETYHASVVTWDVGTL